MSPLSLKDTNRKINQENLSVKPPLSKISNHNIDKFSESLHMTEQHRKNTMNEVSMHMDANINQAKIGGSLLSSNFLSENFETPDR